MQHTESYMNCVPADFPEEGELDQIVSEIIGDPVCFSIALQNDSELAGIAQRMVQEATDRNTPIADEFLTAVYAYALRINSASIH